MRDHRTRPYPTPETPEPSVDVLMEWMDRRRGRPTSIPKDATGPKPVPVG